MTDSESKRTEYLRAQMSLGERVEVLERQVDRLKDRKVTVDWASMTTDKIDDLARRVAEIEKGGSPKFACVSGFTPGSEGPRHEYVECVELARLRRIEEQLKTLRKALMWNGSVSAAAWLTDIDAALDSEPKR